jgi:hypothetical protein
MASRSCCPGMTRDRCENFKNIFAQKFGDILEFYNSFKKEVAGGGEQTRVLSI